MDEIVVSVIMGIYNCAETLSEAVESIRNQTYPNWELIMCDDGSKDDTYQIAKELESRDKRIKVIKNSCNMGLSAALNHCLKYAQGKYIARMDGDDVSCPDRFEKQVRFLDTHQNYAIVSTPMILFDENGDWGRTRNGKTAPSKEDVVTGSPICHAPSMFRKECLLAVNGYTEGKRIQRVEDVDLWIKLYSLDYLCYNLDEPLYRMRNDPNAFKRRKYIYRINSTIVRLKGCRKMSLSARCYLKSFYPMIIGIIPSTLRRSLKKKLSK